jgi:hypothetical protein
VLTYADGSILSYTLEWQRTPPGDDTPPFELIADNSDFGPEFIDLEDADSLESWLVDLQTIGHY